MGFYLIGPLVTIIPLGSISSWAFKPYCDEDVVAALAEAEAEEVRVRLRNGVAVGWCDQVRVLSHAAVGCLVTHCGWNSVLESVASGVPMVCVPRMSDQRMNAQLAVTTPGWRQVELDNLTSVLDTTTSSSSNFSGKPANANVYSYYMFCSSWEGKQA